MKAINENEKLRDFLDQKVLEYNQPAFIPFDPVSVPHRFDKIQDIEIAGLFTAIFSWGNRNTIIKKSNELMSILDDAPFDFIRKHRASDLKRLLTFKHRTFNPTDLLYFIRFLKHHYEQANSLEDAFLPEQNYPENEFIKNALTCFYSRFFSLKDAPTRTRKHIASPQKNSTCKRLNMYLRWMVRTDKKGVDFGIWKRISSADLICPVDLHVARVARRFGLIRRQQTDWQTAMELTLALRSMDEKDPVKYDFALFSLGVTEKY